MYTFELTKQLYFLVGFGFGVILTALFALVVKLMARILK